DASGLRSPAILIGTRLRTGKFAGGLDCAPYSIGPAPSGLGLGRPNGSSRRTGHSEEARSSGSTTYCGFVAGTLASPYFRPKNVAALIPCNQGRFVSKSGMPTFV